MSAKNIIKSLDFFKSLDENQIDILADISTINSYNKDSIFCYEKNESNKLVFLVEGLAKAYKIDKHENEIVLYYIHQNSMLSETSNLNELFLKSFSNISFIDDSKILSIDYQIFRNNFLKKNILNMEFTNEIVLKSQQLQALINREFIFDAVAKVSMMLSSDLEMFNKLKRHDISLMLHIQPSTLSRVLNRLKRNNIIDIVHGKVSITNYQELDLIFKGL